MEAPSRFRLESRAASHGTVNFEMDSDTKDVVLTGGRSVASAELKVAENGNIGPSDSNHLELFISF